MCNVEGPSEVASLTLSGEVKVFEQVQGPLRLPGKGNGSAYLCGGKPHPDMSFYVTVSYGESTDPIALVRLPRAQPFYQ